ncbi:Copia protein [Symbiodinium microadriaticum]|uniref:Copia protein n=1 Tax=Symbiodinium microadriaticum TaxID=2951 RepID=A0A1Q9ENA3_SYMMI|nr:Copia protein [Symbiodinium microadriaticum]
MAATRESLRAQLLEMGERPPTRWTKAELQQRVEELTGINPTIRIKNNEVSEYRRLITEMNAAAKKKANLQAFCRDRLRMSQIDNYTIAQMVRAATQEIYHRSTPDPSDMVGFGKYAALTYAELKAKDPRLIRLAGWLDNQPDRVLQAVEKSKQRAASSAASSSATTTRTPMPSTTQKWSGRRSVGYPQAAEESEDKLDKLQEMMLKMQEEIRELKTEPARKKKGIESDSEMSDQSFSLAQKLSLGKALRLERASYEVVPQIFEGEGIQGVFGVMTAEELEAFMSKEAYDSLEAEAQSLYQKGPEAPASKQQIESIKKKLYLLHAATGHGSKKGLVEALKRRGASELVLGLAREFTCSVCAEKKRPPPRNLASLEVLPPKWHTVSTDIGHWFHAHKNLHVQFMLVIDEGSRFRIAKVLTRGSKQQPTGADCVAYLREGWMQVFGTPDTLRLDPAGAFRGETMANFCDRHSIYLDMIPADAHWQIGTCEQAIKGTKELMTKLCDDDPELSPEEALSVAVRTFNSREQIRGFTPIQHAFGRNPDVTGRVIERPQAVPEELLSEGTGLDFEASARRRATAEKALCDWQAQQRISRATNSRSRPSYDYVPGELVYYWRSQASGRSRQQPGGRQGFFLGPARVLATETRRSPEGQLRPGSSIWIVKGRTLLKCCPEQLRRASPREELIEALSTSRNQDPTPWTFQRVVEEIGGNQYEDISGEQFRVRGKRAEPANEEDPEVWGDPEAEAWWSNLEAEDFSKEENAFWCEETAAVAVEIPLPTSNRGMQAMVANPASYFVGAMKRRAAKATEVKNFLAAEAFESLPDHLRPSHDQAVQMRWILTWKNRDDGTVKAKARAVLLGFQDPSYEHRATTSPVMTRQSRQMLMQLTTLKNWKMYNRDVSGAFLQGREYPDLLYCIPCPEICQAMGLSPGSITRLRRACYGLVDAPLEWYKTIAEVLETELGMIRSWSDPCLRMWRPNGEIRGAISGHVDDFLFSGAEEDREWQAQLQRIKDRFKWGDWESGNFTQCGVQVVQDESGFHLSQERYVEGIPEVPLNASRRKQSQEPTTPREQSQLRATLGALSWHAQQVAPHFSAEVSLLLSQINGSTVSTIVKTNQLVERARGKKNHVMRIHRFAEGTELGVFAWVDAASQNRRDGYSTQGLFVGLAPTSMLQGEVAGVSAVSWHSNKISRPCRSPGAAETQAAVNGEDVAYFARYQWGELMYGTPDTRNPEATVSRVVGVLISDSRNVHDKLNTAVLTIKGEEKKANIELLAVKEAQQRTGLIVRWVHSEAQLSNSLTKEGGSHELELYYKMGQQWRIVEDPAMRSSRRRKKDGVAPLQQQTSDGNDVNFCEYFSFPGWG